MRVKKNEEDPIGTSSGCKLRLSERISSNVCENTFLKKEFLSPLLGVFWKPDLTPETIRARILKAGKPLVTHRDFLNFLRDNADLINAEIPFPTSVYKIAIAQVSLIARCDSDSDYGKARTWHTRESAIGNWG